MIVQVKRSKLPNVRFSIRRSDARFTAFRVLNLCLLDLVIVQAADQGLHSNDTFNTERIVAPELWYFAFFVPQFSC